jgi:DNA-binding LacI/PurR family transcriptional regulator
VATGRRSQPRRATVTEVARAADVSVGTASDALNDRGRVSDATRARVLGAAARLGYQPRRSARSLRTGRHLAYGLRVAGGPSIPPAQFFLGVLGGAATAAAEVGCTLAISSTEMDEAGNLDGLIVIDPTDAAELRPAVAAGLTVVVVGRPPAGVTLPSVDAEHAEDIQDLLDHLDSRSASRGRVWLVAPGPATGFTNEVRAGAATWCRARRRELLESTVSARAVGSIEDGLRSTPPTITVVALELHVSWALDRLRAAGVALEEVAVGAASDGPALDLAPVPVSAIDADGERHGREAIAMLERWRDTGAPPPDRRLPARLNRRAADAGGVPSSG